MKYEITGRRNSNTVTYTLEFDSYNSAEVWAKSMFDDYEIKEV